MNAGKIIGAIVCVLMLAGSCATVGSPRGEERTPGTTTTPGTPTADDKAVPVIPNADGPKPMGTTYDYVIITTNDIVANSDRLHNFVYMKELEGHSVKVVTETDFGGLV